MSAVTDEVCAQQKHMRDSIYMNTDSGPFKAKKKYYGRFNSAEQNPSTLTEYSKTRDGLNLHVGKHRVRVRAKLNSCY